jgi:hypothetical protein
VPLPWLWSGVARASGGKVLKAVLRVVFGMGKMAFVSKGCPLHGGGNVNAVNAANAVNAPGE